MNTKTIAPISILNCEPPAHYKCVVCGLMSDFGRKETHVKRRQHLLIPRKPSNTNKEAERGI